MLGEPATGETETQTVGTMVPSVPLGPRSQEMALIFLFQGLN